MNTAIKLSGRDKFVLITVIHFHFSLIFAGKAKSLPNRSERRLLALYENIQGKIDWQWQTL